MSKIAVIMTGGKQYKVAQGSILKIEKLDVEAGSTVKLETLLVADGENVQIGKPSLGEMVEAKIVEHGRADKVSVVKYKNKTRYKRNVGHRQPYTKIEVASIA